MSQEPKSIARRYSRAEQKLRDLVRKNPPARQLTDRIAATSEETAGLFSSGTTPAVRVLMGGRYLPPPAW